MSVATFGGVFTTDGSTCAEEAAEVVVGVGGGVVGATLGAPFVGLDWDRAAMKSLNPGATELMYWIARCASDNESLAGLD